MSSNFPERVRKAMPPSGSGEHPSADVLNAYAERQLPAPESQQVLQHLSTCAECREIIFLATAAIEVPEEELVFAAAAPPAAAHNAPVAKRKVRWWTWAVPLAAVLVVASVWLLQSDRFLQQRSVVGIAKYSQQQTVALQNEKSSPAPPQPAAAPESSLHPTGVPAASPAIAAKPRDLAKDQSSSKTTGFAANSAALKQGSTAENRNEPMAGAAGVTSERVAASAPAADALDKSVTAAVQASGDSSVETTQAAEAGTSTRLAATAAKPQRALATANARKSTVAVSWRVTPNGGLEHLVAGQWQPYVSSPSANLLAAGSFGNDVWVAAKGHALYHSGDNGTQWERQTLPAEVSGEIVQMGFTSALDGILTTSDGERWATHDGGKTWAKLTPSP